jgi:hypothetical protein
MGFLFPLVASFYTFLITFSLTTKFFTMKKQSVILKTFFQFALFAAFLLTTLIFSSCDKGDASLEITVTGSGLKVSNFPLTIKEGSTTNTVSTNLNGVALFSDLFSGSYTLSWSATKVTFTNGTVVNVLAGSKEFTIDKGKVHTGTVSF